MKYNVVIWDFDGTLAYTCEDVWESIEYAANVCNGKVSEIFREKNSNLGRQMEEIFKAIEPFPGKGMFEIFQEQIRIHYREISDYPNTIFYPGILELLQYLTENSIKCYIISLKPVEALERILVKKGWEGYFDGWFSPDSFKECEKTKSELISHLIKSSHFLPGKTVYIGDTYSDVIAAKDNGVDCIGVTYGDGEAEKLLEADPMAVVDDVYEICQLISEV